MTREVEGYDGENEEHLAYRQMHSMRDVRETSLTLDRVVNLDGTVPFDTKTLSFHEDDIVQVSAFQYEDPDDEHRDAYYGYLSHVYHRTVSRIRDSRIDCALTSAQMVLFMPRKQRVAFSWKAVVGILR